MTQRIENNARSRLVGALDNEATTFSIEVGSADLFPVANTTDWLERQDWFKATLMKNTGQYEIVYVGVRNLGSGLLSNVLRGREGTTAIPWDAGSVFGLRFTALDLQDMRNGVFPQVTVEDDLTVGGAIVAEGTVKAAPAVEDDEMPQLQQVKDIAYSLTIQSTGLAVDSIFSTAADVAIPVGLPAGRVLGVYNDSNAAIDIVQGAGVTLEFAGSLLTGDRILTGRGLMFIMTLTGAKYSVMGPGLV